MEDYTYCYLFIGLIISLIGIGRDLAMLGKTVPYTYTMPKFIVSIISFILLWLAFACLPGWY